MKQFMFVSTLPHELSDEFRALIPEQRAKVNRLLEEGVILAYSLAFDRSLLWTVVEAESEAEAKDIFAGLPLHDFMESEITELIFHNSVSTLLPQPSLN